MSAQSYDPSLRRDTPLAGKLIARIRAAGPMTVSQYMDACLNDAEHGYYRSRSAIGRDGDFITAPEISQVFGELIGLWAAVVWQQMGAPAEITLIELGAGRGTLMADALRAARVVPQFYKSVSVHILDQNSTLIASQRPALAACGVPVTWHANFADIPAGAPSVVIANEFLDTLPVVQISSDGHERKVGLDAAGQLQFFGDAALETQQAAGLLQALEARGLQVPLGALFIDYGFTGKSSGDTLQAVRAHQFEHPLTSPGEADLSVHVSFDDVVSASGLVADGPTTQAEFLGRLGVVERTSKLMSRNPGKANALEIATARLMQPNGMGTRFKVLGLRSPSLPALPGF